MWESPIQIIPPDTWKEIQRRNGEEIMTCVQATVGIKVDKEELIKALRYDRNQYEKGYADGANKVMRRGYWIEDRTDVLCSLCGCRYNYEIFCMSHEDNAFSHCPKCGGYLERR